MKHTLKAVSTLGFLANDIENGIDELSSLGVIYNKAKKENIVSD